jgi:hypothetical protein
LATAEAPMTFGQSIAIAIPECVQIAVECAGKIAGKMAELLSSAEALMKIIEGAVGVVKLVKQVLSFIGKQSQSGAQGTPTTAQPSSSTSSKPSTTQTQTGDRLRIPGDQHDGDRHGAVGSVPGGTGLRPV